MHIHAIFCPWSSWCDRLDPCHQVTLVFCCMQHISTFLRLWRALAHHSASMLICAVYIDAKPCRCVIAHQTWNSARFSSWKWGVPVAIFSCWKFGENSIWRAMMQLRWSTTRFPSRKWGEMLSDFCRGNLASTSNTLEKHRSGPHPFWNQTSKPNTFKAPKAKANSLFWIAYVQNYVFSKIKDYLRLCVVGCLTPYPSTLDYEKWPFS